MRTKLAIVSVLFIGFFLGCRPEEEFPLEPVLAVESIDRISSNTIKVTFSFTDGDGNVGLNDNDTLAPNNCPSCQYYYNLFLDYQDRSEGGTFEDQTPAVPYHYRVPFVRPTGQDPKQKGTIEYEIFDFALPGNDPVQVRFNATLVDRDFQSSNTVVVGPIDVAQ